jgi:hypothetical protein
LPKDAGITDTQEKIEEGLRKAQSVDNVWNGLLKVADIRPGSKEDLDLQDLYVRSLDDRDRQNELKTRFGEFLTDITRTVGTALLHKAIELGIKMSMGGE